MKPMTHTGIVETNGRRPHWRAIRETPKFWTDGVSKWRKLKHDGTPNMNPQGGSTWHGTSLDISSSRPLTIEEQWAPLVKEVLMEEKRQQHCADDLLKAQKRVDEAKRAVAASAKTSKAADDALAKFCKKHNLDQEAP